jgi:hypothetical protein
MERSDPDTQAGLPDGQSESGNYLPDLWYLMAGRIAPQICCRYPNSLQRSFTAAVREVSKRDGDLDQAVRLLHDIIIQVPCDWIVFQQAGELLNIIEWRRTYHPGWFHPNTRGNRLKLGACGSFVAQALALLESGSDDEAVALTAKILKKGDAESDDPKIAHLIRAALFICSGEIARGEEEFCQVSNLR